MEEAGAFALVMEMVPGEVAAQITKELAIPTIGIGAGPHCDAQVLVWQDAFGLRTGRMAKFVKQYADVHGVLLEAAQELRGRCGRGDLPGARAHLRRLRSSSVVVMPIRRSTRGAASRRPRHRTTPLPPPQAAA